MSRYKVGQKFKDTDVEDLVYTILAVSPDVDYEGDMSYFVEVISNGKDKWYNVTYDSSLEDFELID